MLGDGEENKVSAESCLLRGSRRLPILIFFEEHKDPNIKDFFKAILPVLKKQEYKKYLSESLDNKKIDAQYLGDRIANCSRKTEELSNFYKKLKLNTKVILTHIFFVSE